MKKVVASFTFLVINYQRLLVSKSMLQSKCEIGVFTCMGDEISAEKIYIRKTGL